MTSGVTLSSVSNFVSVVTLLSIRSILCATNIAYFGGIGRLIIPRLGRVLSFSSGLPVLTSVAADSLNARFLRKAPRKHEAATTDVHTSIRDDTTCPVFKLGYRGLLWN